jgi:anti-anti-sigma regulatory factor
LSAITVESAEIVSSENPPNELQFTRREAGAIAIEGELTHVNAEAFEKALTTLDVEANGRLVLDMFGFDIDDGVGVATAINALRDLLKRVGRLQLTGAPQILCHNLYRVGLLDANTTIELIDMRQDEPYG